MKNIRKLFAVVLTVVMMLSLSMPGLAYYSGISDTAYSEKYIMALNTLYGLGIIPDNTPIDYETGVTREQFAQYASALLGGRTFENIQEPKEQNITLGEAVQILVDGTENSLRAEKYGYMGIAGQMGITHGLVRMQSYDNLTYGAAIQMLYNSMRITPGDMASISTNGYEYIFDENRTVLTEYLGVEYRNGFVTADSFWSLNPSENLDENQIVINGNSFKVKNPLPEDYVGFFVNYYYHSNDDVILAVEKSNSSQQVILNSSKIRSYNNNEYVYDDDGAKKKYRVAPGAYIISNFVPDFSSSIDMYPKNSDVILVDANGDSTYETVFIKTYTEIKVSVIDVEGKIISGKGSGTYNLSEDYPARVYLNGKKVDYNSVTTNTQASLVVEPETKIVREIYLSNKTVEGTISMIQTDGDNIEVVINDETYFVSAGLTNREKLNLGSTAVFALNFKGEIAYFDTTAGSGGVAYVIEAGNLEGLGRRTLQMHLFTDKGEHHILNVSDKCKLNGQKTEQNITDLFVANDETTIQQLISYKTNSKGEISDITLPLSSESGLIYSDYRLHASLVSESEYELAESSGSLNEKKLIGDDTIIFNVPNFNSENERDYQLGNKPVSNYFKAYNYKINQPFADVIVSVRQSALSSDGVCGGPGPEIIKNQTGDYCIVKDVRKAYVEEYDDYFDQIEFINSKSGIATTKILADNAQWVAFGTPTNQVDVINYTVGGKDLAPGDIFHYSLNTMDEIGTVHKAYDASEGSLVKGTWDNTSGGGAFDYTDPSKFGTWSSAYIRLIQGYAVDSGEDYLALTRTGPGKDISTIAADELMFFKSNTYTYVYKVTAYGNDVEIKKITLGQIPPALNANQKVVVTLNSGANIRLVALYDVAE